MQIFPTLLDAILRVGAVFLGIFLVYFIYLYFRGELSSLVRRAVLLPFDQPHREELNETELRRRFEQNPIDIENLRRYVVSALSRTDRRTWDTALALLTKYQPRLEQIPDYWMLRAEMYLQLQDPELAKTLATSSALRAVLLDPENPKWYRLVGYIYWKYGDLYQAVDETRKAIDALRKRPRSPDRDRELAAGLGNVAYYYADLDTNLEEAHQLAIEAADLDRSSANLDTLAVIKTKFARSHEELDDAERLLREAATKEGAITHFIEEHLRTLAKRRKELPHLAQVQ